MITQSNTQPTSAFIIEKINDDQCDILFFENVKEIEIEERLNYEYDLHRLPAIYRDNLAQSVESNYNAWIEAAKRREIEFVEPLSIEQKVFNIQNELGDVKSQSVNGDLELMSQQFDLDFRIFEIETTLDIPTQLNLKGAKNMAMTVFQQAQTLILAGKYERTDMEYKLKRYLDKNRITQAEYDELIAMMDAQELTK